ncbi:MAG: carboxypeptidase regulatory-like domain-containing protein, partial [Actinomycetota bacterium]|nr:carboxypeptidase regulatory-like domain-containing protein [Actinomycetota bacterium]
MKQSRVSAFARVARWSGRFGRTLVLAAVALALGAGSLLAQGATGKLEGRVRDQSGAPVANAQVIIVGTAFNATTNNQGYYFINNVPAGVLDVRAQFVGYRPTQIANVRMLAGQTITQDITMEATPVEITELTVIEAVQPLVPRDEVTTKQRISGEYTDKLPVDRINQVLALQPGVVASTSGNTLSIRGSRSDESATYIDGIPTQRGQRGSGFVDNSGSSGVTVGTNSLEEASVTTGASSSEFGNAQAGIISLQTRSGSASAYSGALSFETDEPFGKGGGLGYNKLQGSFGGPTRLLDNLTFYVSATLEGQRSTTIGTAGVGAAPGIDSDDEPIFQRAGIDTIVQSGTTVDTVYNFAITRGDCDAFSSSTNEEIANNYGVDCSGIRLPNSNASAYQLQGKLNYSYGTGSRLALSLIGSQQTNRNFSLVNLYNPDTQLGSQAWARYAILNWTQNLSKSTERALALETNLSYQADRFIQSPFVRGEAPDAGFLGFQLSGHDFLYDFEQWEGEDIAFDEDLIAAYRRNDQTSPRAPCILPVKDPSDCNVRNQVRNNPYGLSAFNESGGPVGRLQLYRENRLVGRSTLDWQFDRYNRLRAGGEVTKYDIDFYSHQINSQAFSDAYMEEPLRYAFFAEDRLDLGDVVLIGGLRYDYYNSNASRPYFVCDAVQDEADGTVDNSCGGVLEVGERQIFPRISTSPNVVGQPDQEAAIEAIYFEDESHDYLSPHIQVSFPVTDRTNFRLSYAHQVQAPD